MKGSDSLLAIICTALGALTTGRARGAALYERTPLSMADSIAAE